jgi:RNA polymerase sigma-70 factor (ECF subfamily)
MDDRELVRAARRGDRDAAAELFRRHWTAAWRAAYGLTGRRGLADDAAADGFERAFAALDRFDDRRPFRPWLHRIVVNRALDLLRTERRLAAEVEFEAAVELEDGDRALLEAVAHLAPQRRAVVILRYGIGMPPDEIAAVLDLPVGTVHSRLARALTELREVRDLERS